MSHVPAEIMPLNATACDTIISDITASAVTTSGIITSGLTTSDVVTLGVISSDATILGIINSGIIVDTAKMNIPLKRYRRAQVDCVCIG